MDCTEENPFAWYLRDYLGAGVGRTSLLLLLCVNDQQLLVGLWYARAGWHKEDFISRRYVSIPSHKEVP